MAAIENADLPKSSAAFSPIFDMIFRLKFGSF